jgi:hypothetical protein
MEDNFNRANGFQELGCKEDKRIETDQDRAKYMVLFLAVLQFCILPPEFVSFDISLSPNHSLF